MSKQHHTFEELYMQNNMQMLLSTAAILPGTFGRAGGAAPSNLTKATVPQKAS